MRDMTARVLQLRGYGAKLHEIVSATGLSFGEVYGIFKANPEVQPPVESPPVTIEPPTRRPSSVSYAAAVEPEDDLGEDDDDQDDDDFEDDEEDDDNEPEPAVVESKECERRQRLRKEREAVVKKRPSLYGEASLPSRDRSATAFPEDWEQSEIVFSRKSGDTLAELARRYNLPSWIIKEVLSAKGIR